MRRSLDLLYRLSGALAAVFLAAICVVVVLQVGANIIDTVFVVARGEPIGLVVPSYAEFTGFFLVAASFLALASALRAGSHIRVTLVIRLLGSRARRWVEVWCAATAAAVTLYFTWYAVGMVADSFRFNDISSGIVPVPIWIPQSAMALGLIVFAIALIDELIVVARGDIPTYEENDVSELAGIKPEADDEEERR